MDTSPSCVGTTTTDGNVLMTSASITVESTDAANAASHFRAGGTLAKKRASLPSANSAFVVHPAHLQVGVDELAIERRSDNLLAALTLFISHTYKSCDPKFKPIQTLPQRILTVPSEPVLNNGKDNQDANLICRVHDKLGSGERIFTILDLLGTGTFGQVFRCKKDDSKELFAVKVIKNKPAYHNQGKLEIKIAQLLNTQYDPHNDRHIVRLFDFFEHHGHICLVFELLNMSLLDLLTQNQFRGLPLSLVQKYTKQILTALVVLEEASIIHCDLKPENILLQPFSQSKPKRGSSTSNLPASSVWDGINKPDGQSQSQSDQHNNSSRRSTAHMSDVKVIDFGSACFEGRTIYSYIQSRFYRSPEVLLGCPYTGAIDMWSLACVCAEMYLGLPLFPGVSQHNQLSRIVEMFGNPPDFLIECKNGNKYFAPVAVGDIAVPPSGGKPTFQSAPNLTKYRLKTPEEYAAETKTEVPVLKKYLKYNVLDEVILKCFPSHKLRLTPEQKSIEINRRKCFIDFLYGLFRLNPFDRWSAKQAMEHPFIKNTPFLEPFVPPQDLKLQERKLMFMVQLQQRGSSSSSTAASNAMTNATRNGDGLVIRVKDDACKVLQGQRAPTNFGSNMVAAQSAFAPLQLSQRNLSDPIVDSSGLFSGVAKNSQPLQSKSAISSNGNFHLPASPISPPKNLFDSDERPILKRGAPVHLNPVALLNNSADTSIADDSSKETVLLEIIPKHDSIGIEDATSLRVASVAVSAGITDSKAPKPTGNIGRHKPRHSFTTRVEQHMLKPQEVFNTGITVVNPHHISMNGNNIGALGGGTQFSQSLHIPVDPGQIIHDNRKQAFQQQLPQSTLHHGASSWNPFSSASIHHNHGIHGLFSSSGTQHTASSHHSQQHSIWHSNMTANSNRNHPSGPVSADAIFMNSAHNSNLIATESLNPSHHQPYPPQPAPEFYVGSIGGHFSGSLGGSLGVFATGSMQEGGHAMTDFGMALLRPDMDEQRRLLSQQSVNSSSGYWPGHVSSYMPFNNDQSIQSFVSPLGHVNAYGGNSTGANTAVSFDSTMFQMHQQHIQQQSQQQQIIGRQGSVNYPPFQIRRDALSNLSPRASKKNDVPIISITRMRSHSQDSFGEASPRSILQGDIREGYQVSPNNKVTSATRFFDGLGVASYPLEPQSMSEPVSPIKDSSTEENCLTGQKSTPSKSGRQLRRGVSSESMSGKVADSLAEWDPFFESDD